jgi:hypothetical protein
MLQTIPLHKGVGRTIPMTRENDDDRVGIYGSKKALAQGNWEKIVHGLGVISIEFQTLETVVKVAIGRIVSKQDRVLGAIVTANLSFGAAIDLLYALFEYEWEGSDRAKKLKPILDRCIVAEQKRNQLIHSAWYEPTTYRGPTRVKFIARNRKGLRVHHEELTQAEMNQLAEKLQTLTKELALFFYEIYGPSDPA